MTGNQMLLLTTSLSLQRRKSRIMDTHRFAKPIYNLFTMSLFTHIAAKESHDSHTI
jgi:hypothetical protein